MTTRTTLLDAVAITGPGSAFSDRGQQPSFTITVAGSGAVSATVDIEGRNAAGGAWGWLATSTLSGTGSATDNAGSLVRYMEYRGNVKTISGSGAAVTLTMGS